MYYWLASNLSTIVPQLRISPHVHTVNRRPPDDDDDDDDDHVDAANMRHKML